MIWADKPKFASAGCFIIHAVLALTRDKHCQKRPIEIWKSNRNVDALPEINLLLFGSSCLMHAINYIVYYQAIYKETVTGCEKEERREDGCVIFRDEQPPFWPKEMDGHWWTSFKCLDMVEGPSVATWVRATGQQSIFGGVAHYGWKKRRKKQATESRKGKIAECNEHKGKRWMMLVRKTTLVVSWWSLWLWLSSLLLWWIERELEALGSFWPVWLTTWATAAAVGLFSSI